MKFTLVSLLAGLILASQPMSAHHAAATKYDENKPIKLKGTVTKLEWLNPHVYFYIDVKDSSGNVVNWAIENAPPNVLYRRGWTKESLKVGDSVTVEGFLPREEGLHHVNGRTATLADGRRIFAGSGDGLPGGPAYQ
jgi:hypothetical protein